MQDGGQERQAPHFVPSTPIQEWWSISRGLGDDGRGSAGERDDERGMRLVVQERVVVEMVDDLVVALVKVDFKLTPKVPPELGEVGCEYEQDISPLLNKFVQLLRTQILR